MIMVEFARRHTVSPKGCDTASHTGINKAVRHCAMAPLATARIQCRHVSATRGSYA